MSVTQSNRVSRRDFLRLGLGIAGAAGALSLGIVDRADAAPLEGASQAGGGPNRKAVRESIDRAYEFLNTMMDAYAQGNTLRLIQSYSDQLGLWSTAFVYDNALAIIAYLERGTAEDVARARILGDSLLYAQNHDLVNDGRLRQAYFVAPSFVLDDGSVNLAAHPFWFTGSAVGDMAWSALALTRLYSRTRDPRYLDGAVRLGEWIVDNTYSDVGLGGYSFGVGPNGVDKIPNKSTEHNIDVYALFTMLAKLDDDPAWTQRANHALAFIQKMWQPTEGFFYTGSNDGVTINPSPRPEDPQTWSYLALRDRRYAASIDWAHAQLRTTDVAGSASFTGVTFSDVSLRANPGTNPNAVWFEGTAQLAAALLERHAPGDRKLAMFYLDNIRKAQETLGQGQTVNGRALPTGYGVVAASSPLNTGFGFSYFPNLHTGATAWYLIAAQSGNPFQLRHGKGPVY